ncbi:uncharacterized protein N0V89_007691 [Didymosphaeria variabile]|uniref:Uncharacterized protein n=1 Tax=Didymosphaeria variabile TaxID=1932322 RepID=A0A9W9CAI6_9PLEO|nr:uncharacterized protein N0V89_007691 [Didymosphaeria variabile]KAJ4352343.1 hypothetical protein N0V89_007691 [Didymosphaeria variabile]
MFTCGHLSLLYVDRCITAFKPGNEACTPSADTDHDPEAFKEQLRQEARTSYFACFDCLEAEGLTELRAAAEVAAAKEKDPDKRDVILVKMARYEDRLVKVEANRKAAEVGVKVEREQDRAEGEVLKAEKEQDRAAAEALKVEKDRAAKEEGAWIEAPARGSARKKKGKHGRVFQNPTQSAPPTPTFGMGVEGGVGGRAGKMGEFRKDEPKSANEVDAGSRAEAWPKKILTKGENQREGAWRK